MHDAFYLGKKKIWDLQRQYTIYNNEEHDLSLLLIFFISLLFVCLLINSLITGYHSSNIVFFVDTHRKPLMLWVNGITSYLCEENIK